MTRSYKAVSISFLALAFLVGCGDDKPSNSDIKKAILSSLSPCPELSISDFQKLNGYPQNDGSYIDQIQYSLVFTPSDQMLHYVADYHSKLDAIKSEGAADDAKAKTLRGQVQSMSDACSATYTTSYIANKAAMDAAFKAYLVATNSYSVQTAAGEVSLGNNPSEDLSMVDNSIRSAQAMIRFDQGQIQDDQNSVKSALAEEAKEVSVDYGISLADAEAQIAASKTTDPMVPNIGPDVAKFTVDIAAQTELIKALSDLRPNVANAVNQYSSCQGNVQIFAQNNEGPIIHLRALNAEYNTLQTTDLKALQREMNTNCPIIVIGGVLGIFGKTDDQIDSYGASYKVNQIGSLHLVHSDNGWVIQS